MWLVTSHGTVLIAGKGAVTGIGQTPPDLPTGVGYSSVAVGGDIAGTLFVRTDGQAVTCRGTSCPYRFEVPALPLDVQYVMGAAGNSHYVLLRSDGQAVAVHYGGVHCPVPELPEGVTFTSVAAGDMHTLLVRSDGQALALSACFEDQWKLAPTPPAGTSYVSAAGGLCHSVLIRSDGKAVECGRGFDGILTYDSYKATNLHDFEECHVLEVPAGVTYVKAAAGAKHTVLVRSDGRVDAFGDNSNDQCCVPDLPEGVSYVSAVAGDLHTVLVRSDGQAVAFGKHISNIICSQDGIQPPVEIGGQVVVPELPTGTHFVEVARSEIILVTIETKDTGKQVEMIVKFAASGEELATLRFSKNRFKTEKLGQLRESITSKADIPMHQLKIILPNGTVVDLKDDSKKMKSVIPEDSSELVAENNNHSTDAAGYAVGATSLAPMSTA